MDFSVTKVSRGWLYQAMTDFLRHCPLLHDLPAPDLKLIFLVKIHIFTPYSIALLPWIALE